MQVRVGCEFRYESAVPTPTVWQVRPRPDGAHRVLTQSWETTPDVEISAYRDSFGNLCDRMTLPEGPSRIRYDANVEVPPTYDEADKGAVRVPVDRVPSEALLYLLPSRFCLTELMRDRAGKLFGNVEPGWQQVQAICDWVNNHLTFGYGASTATTTAVDAYERGTGVCRDFAHLAITFCRALNIPARYVCGYLPDIAVTPPDEPMDFCAWFEAYLEDRWWTFDARINVPRIGRVVIGHGRDAVDVAMVTAYGPVEFKSLTVWADEVVPSGV
jgi:transglutaminase-like putative cysteine protease